MTLFEFVCKAPKDAKVLVCPYSGVNLSRGDFKCQRIELVFNVPGSFRACVYGKYRR